MWSKGVVSNTKQQDSLGGPDSILLVRWSTEHDGERTDETCFCFHLIVFKHIQLFVMGYFRLSTEARRVVETIMEGSLIGGVWAPCLYILYTSLASILNFTLSMFTHSWYIY